ncbi:MAG TPA: glycosyltransferase family 4 protein [Candidatus Eisenbacteria bacterium]|jgi:glycosyltransferase involved in cell wall biosynthesis
MISVAPNRAHVSCVGYVMMAYARIDDAFITNEIYLLERLGLGLHVFSVKPLDHGKRHASVDRIQATIRCLPDPTSGSRTRLVWRHVRAFWRSHLRLLRRRPRAYVGTLLFALGLHLKYRFPLRSRKITEEQFLVDFLRAGPLALEVLESPCIRHLHGHFCHASTTITMMVSRLTGVPFSFTAHAKDIYLSKFNPGDLLQRKLRGAAFVVTCTEVNRARLQRLCPDLTSLHRIYHGIDTAIFAPRIPPPGDAGGVPRILAVGRFVEKKGFPYLVRACRVLRDLGHAFRCDIVGRPDRDSEAVRRLIEEGKLGETVFVSDALTHDELKELYERCTIFCLPCVVAGDGDMDGIPNVLVEAMAMGIPVVATGVSAIPELIEDGVNGLLVPEKDVPALAGALERLLEDAALRGRLGRAACETVRGSFDAERTTRALNDLFVSSLAGTVGASS